MDPLKHVRWPITNSDVVSYDINGGLIVANILSPEECDDLLETFESLADKEFSALMNMDRKNEKVRNIVKLPQIVFAIERLQRWEVDVVQSQFLFKKSGSSYQKQAWNPHQDNSYPRMAYGTYITTNIFLADANKENGCMYMYPGSHRESLLPFIPTASHKETPGTNPGNSIEVPPEYEKVDLVIKKGAMFVMNSHLIHGSHPNISDTRSRPLFSISYASKGAEVPRGINANRMRMPVRGFDF